MNGKFTVEMSHLKKRRSLQQEKKLISQTGIDKIMTKNEIGRKDKQMNSQNTKFNKTLKTNRTKLIQYCKL